MLIFNVKVVKIMSKKGTAFLNYLYINHLESFALFSVYKSIVVEVAKDFPKELVKS